MATARLHHDDPWRLTFEARVIRAEARDDAVLVELDASAFYPESGGQTADRGELHLGDRVLSVRDVQIDEAGRVLHEVEGADGADGPGADWRPLALRPLRPWVSSSPACARRPFPASIYRCAG